MTDRGQKLMEKTAFRSYLEQQRVVCSHTHHLRDGEHRKLNLQGLLSQSYAGWCGLPVPEGNDPAAQEAWLRAAGTRSYFVWMEKALMALCGIGEPLCAGNWADYDKAVREAHRDPDWHLRILRERCRYETAFLDCYWAPGEDNGHPELFRPVYRVNSMFYGYNQTAQDHNGNNLQRLEGTEISGIDAYLALVRRVLRDRKKAGCVLFKCALAYDRGLDFGPADKALAQKAMRENPEEPEVLAFQNLVMETVCQTAEETGTPLQIHTGLGLMQRSAAMALQPLIARHPGVSFILMHGSYPWTQDIAGLCHAYPNVWADLCWLPLISSAAAERLLHELIDVCNADRIIWGCDAWTGEESYAARLAFLEVLSRVLCQRAESGLMREETARRFARMVLYDNAKSLMKDDM